MLLVYKTSCQLTALERTHLRHYRVEGFAPVLARIVHHQVDKNRHQECENGGTVADLRPVHTAVSGRAAVDQLITQDVQPVEHKTQHLGCVT
jgi:hypothetical protein